MKRGLKLALLGLGGLVCSSLLLGGIYVLSMTSAFDASIGRAYEVPLPEVARSGDPAVLARGRHLVESIAACTTRDCHGADLGGGKALDLSPLAVLAGPNITSAGILSVYSDGELARLLKYGIKKDGRSVLLMPVQEFGWLPDSDVAAVVSYLRTVPAVDRASGPVIVKPLAKILDRRGLLTFDVARYIQQHPELREPSPPPSATPEYGRFLGRLCTGCHGEHLSGGPIPGAPPSLPVPPNVTPHETGLRDWSFVDFERLLNTGVRKNGKPLDPFMPYAALAKLDAVEKQALWAFLRGLPPRPAGQR